MLAYQATADLRSATRDRACAFLEGALRLEAGRRADAGDYEDAIRLLTKDFGNSCPFLRAAIAADRIAQAVDRTAASTTDIDKLQNFVALCHRIYSEGLGQTSSERECASTQLRLDRAIRLADARELMEQIRAQVSQGQNEQAIANCARLQKDAPDAPEAAECDELMPAVYVAWAKDALAANDYRTANERVTALESRYPSFVAGAGDVVPNLYLACANAAVAAEEYTTAVEQLTTLVSRYRDFAGRTEMKDAWWTAYLGYWRILAAKADFPAVKSILFELNRLADTPERTAAFLRASAEAKLLEAKWQVLGQEYNHAIHLYEEVEKLTDYPDLVATAQKSLSEAQARLAASTGADAQAWLENARTAACNGLPVTNPIIAMTPEAGRKVLVCPDAAIAWQQAELGDLLAKSPRQAFYVLKQLDAGKDALETCQYVGTFDTLTRIRYWTQYQLKDVRTGKVIATKRLSGSMPGECPLRVDGGTEGIDVENSKVYLGGEQVNPGAVANWLRNVIR